MEHTAIDEARAAAIYGGALPEPPGPESSDNPSDNSGMSGNPETPATHEAAIAEAEERGYRRGLEEASRRQLDRPAMWQPVAPDAASAFLASRRPSVWD